MVVMGGGWWDDGRDAGGTRGMIGMMFWGYVECAHYIGGGIIKYTAYALQSKLAALFVVQWLNGGSGGSLRK